MAGVEDTENTENNIESQDADEKTERVNKLPFTRIKSIMKMDPDVSLASQEAVSLIAKSTVNRAFFHKSCNKP